MDRAIVIWYSNDIPALANQFILPFVQTEFSLSANQSYLQFSCSSNFRKGNLVSFDWRVHHTESNNDRISSDNWSSCNACILLVEASTFFKYELKIAQSNIACKRVDGLVASLVNHLCSGLESSDRTWQGHWSSFVILSIF